MQSRDFVYWCQGFFEIVTAGDPKAPVALTAMQTDVIRRHLALVFRHEIDPSMPEPAAKTAHQQTLDEMHSASTSPEASVKPPHTIGGHAPGRPDILYRC